jgi:methionine sulfoxide reductase heme-binding subunit
MDMSSRWRRYTEAWIWQKIFRMLRLTRFQWFVHIGSWIPLAVLVSDYFQGNLSANPVQAVEQRTGLIAIAWLLLSLACTPIHTLTGFRPALKVRRALGLYTFFYAALHFLAFFVWDYAANVYFIWLDVGNKLYIFVGAGALLILIPLAITSTRGMMHKLGKRWKYLHRLVYLAGILVVLHFIWAVKADIRQPLLYATILLVELILRIPWIRRKVSQKRVEWSGYLRQVIASFPTAPEIK